MKIIKIAKIIFNIKDKINNKNGISKKIYLVIYKIILELKGSYIGISTEFKNMPIFPHGINSIFISGGAKLGSNCVVVTDIPDDALVVLQHSKVIEDRINDNRFFSKKDNKWCYLENNKWIDVNDKDILKSLDQM